MIKVRSPISFKEWLQLIGMLILMCAGFLLLEQIPFVDSFLDQISKYISVQSEYIY